MSKFLRILSGVTVTTLVGFLVLPLDSLAADLKIGHVDLRRAFYEYEKAREKDEEILAFTEESQREKEVMIQEITRLQEEVEAAGEEARQVKELELNAKLMELQEFDMESRQIILERKDALFREVMGDIERIVVDKGEKGNYDYILDSRNIMYAHDKYDLTGEVIAELNK